MTIQGRMLPVALALAGLLGAAPAFADTVTMKADLKGSNEVPANTTGGTGTVQVTYDTGSKALSWSGTYSGLTGPATAAHFHGPAASGTNAGVVIPAPAPASPFMGKATLTDAQAADLAAGRMYFNVHTTANPGGEIRGQVTK